MNSSTNLWLPVKNSRTCGDRATPREAGTQLQVDVVLVRHYRARVLAACHSDTDAIGD